jgi:hypothetical protein
VIKVVEVVKGVEVNCLSLDHLDDLDILAYLRSPTSIANSQCTVALSSPR